MSPSWFDSHVHLDRLGSEQPWRDAVAAARLAGVDSWLVPGVRRPDWAELLQLVRQVPGAWAAPGLHPLAAGQWDAAARDQLEALLAAPEAVAVGEIGLDGLLEVPEAMQREAFVGQLELAVAAGKPVLIHCRKAWDEVLVLLRRHGAARVGGVLHAFGGSPEIARQALRLGFVISFGGPLSYPEARRRVEVLKGLPAEAIVVETDAPDLSPHPHRREANRPQWLPLIGACLARLRGWPVEQAARQTRVNIERVLGLGHPVGSSRETGNAGGSAR